VSCFLISETMFLSASAIPICLQQNSKIAVTVAGEGEDGYGTYAAGNRLPYAPKHMLTLNLSYERPDGWRGRIGLTHLSRQFGNAQNYAGTSPEGYQGGDLGDQDD
jgi:outer membrane receptor protein involved in Fe transport